MGATLLTPDVIKATVRLQMLSGRLDEPGARTMAAEAIDSSELVVLVEIDPREGSGVIPDEWIAQLEPRVTRRRDYAYDRFWVSFPLTKDGVSTIAPEATDIQLVARIYDKVGRVTWPLTPELRRALGGVPK